jgi:hypothetical protein
MAKRPSNQPSSGLFISGGNAPSPDTEPVAFAPSFESDIPSDTPESAGTDFDPAAPLGRKADGTPYKRRRNGSAEPRPQQTKTASKLSVDAVSAALLSIHAMLAALTREPRLALDPSECKALAMGIADVAQHYPHSVMDPKTVAWGNLAVIAMGTYGTRAFAIMNDRKKEQKQRQSTQQQAPAANVFGFPLSPNA